MSIYGEDREAEMSELRYQARVERAHQRKLWAHPDCRDPDHPGCDACEESDEDEESDDGQEEE